jgi:hypothetical protein
MLSESSPFASRASFPRSRLPSGVSRPSRFGFGVDDLRAPREYLAGGAIGLDGDTASDYVRLHGGDTSTLAESLAFVQKTAAEIIATLTATLS